MKSSVVAQLHSDFEALVQTEEETGVEFWMARDLQDILGYARWENFAKVIENRKGQNCLYDIGLRRLGSFP